MGVGGKKCFETLTFRQEENPGGARNPLPEGRGLADTAGLLQEPQKSEGATIMCNCNGGASGWPDPICTKCNEEIHSNAVRVGAGWVCYWCAREAHQEDDGPSQD